ncbi:tetratricopeptide repeat protein [Chromohalobacter nigrandesensis]|uniref:tetratricopeptide repeat protein n=1 Tax=Chromohalobacter nigrandesensis TaxID=119863 RepID=UPI001FF468FD|nr:tetratricopeptide repeat protein [Chromohalobacter nigrandesensis]MCK0746829.1 sel1 repeat family protein [Chromohalobacter nigrandesensis]
MKAIIFLAAMLMVFSVKAEVLFQDPTYQQLNQAIEAQSKESITDLSGPDVEKNQYILGLLYLRGSKDFGIRKDCDKATSLLKGAWSSGIIDAGYALAAMYYAGECVDKNVAQSRHLATEAASSGYVLAQRMLGRAYWGREWEELYPRDMQKAVYWLSQAGEAGDRQSSGNLAYIYKTGDGVEKDYRKSFLWQKKAAFAKFSESPGVGFYPLAKYYEKGIGTDIDLVKAYKYYDLSGTAGAEGKQRVAKKMTQEQIDEAIRQSQAWQEEHNIQVGGGFIRRVD